MKKYNINNLYIIEAKKIRNEYLENTMKITNKDDIIIKIKDELLSLNEIITENDIGNIDKDIIDNRILTLSNSVDKLTKEVDIIVKIKENLVKRSELLYSGIKSIYPNITQSDIVEIFKPHMIDIDKKYGII